MGSWKLLEHTADIALEGEGQGPEEALCALAEGLLAQIVEPGSVRSLEERRFCAGGDDREDAVVSFLGELLFAVFGDGWLPGRCGEVRMTATGVEGIFWGEAFDPARHRISEVKAATYHDFSLARGADGKWRLRVIFDV